MGGTTAEKAAKKRKSGTEVVVVSNETSSADTSESSSEIRKTTTVIPKKQSKKSPKESESIDPFKYFVSRSELQNSIHENDFNQFDGYNNNWEDYLSNNPSYKIKVTAKEAMALSNPLNAKWKEVIISVEKFMQVIEKVLLVQLNPFIHTRIMINF